MEVMFSPLKRSRIKLTRKNLARVPWPKHRPVTGGWWDSGNVCQMRRRLWIFVLNLWVGLGWVGLFGWFVVVFCCHFLFCFGRPGQIRRFAVWSLALGRKASHLYLFKHYVFRGRRTHESLWPCRNGEAWRVAFFLISESRKSWQILGFLSLIPEGAPLNLMIWWVFLI